MDAKILRDKLPGAELALQDEDIVEHFRFHGADDGVAATLGSVSGPVCGPLLHYFITDDAKVVISDQSSILFTWEQVELSDSVLTARCGSLTKRFSFTQAKKRERYLP